MTPGGMDVWALALAAPWTPVTTEAKCTTEGLPALCRERSRSLEVSRGASGALEEPLHRLLPWGAPSTVSQDPGRSAPLGSGTEWEDGGLGSRGLWHPTACSLLRDFWQSLTL